LEQNNPQDATYVISFEYILNQCYYNRLAYQRKGWTNHELGVEWIKDFDRKSKEKARGRPRLLLVDGHSSHYTYEFLRYAKDNNITVVCYPAHSTHIYQGLDVACFGSMKRCWQEECFLWEESSGGALTKESFLEVFAKAYTRAFTPETIKSAFRTTGIWPLDQSVISEKDMAPSLALSTSSSSASCSFVTQSGPVLRCLNAIDAAISASSSPPPDPRTNFPSTSLQSIPTTPRSHRRPTPNLIDPTLEEEGHSLVSTLASSGFGSLVSSSPIRSTIFAQPGPLPDLQLLAAQPEVSPRGKALLNRKPETGLEEIYLSSAEMGRNAIDTLRLSRW